MASDELQTFHDQIGYWLWEPATGLVMQTLALPRGQTALAGGHAQPDAARLVVRAERGAPGYGICSTEFLEWAFRTDAYELEVSFLPDGRWGYVSTTVLQVRGRAEPFQHVDRNILGKVGEPTPNPLARISAGEASLAEAHGISAELASASTTGS